MSTYTPDIDALRAMKAERLVGALRAKSLSPADAARLTHAARRAIEREAGVRIGSADTWRVAVGMHAGSARTLCPYCKQGDPRGVPGPAKTYGHEGACAR